MLLRKRTLRRIREDLQSHLPFESQHSNPGGFPRGSAAEYLSLPETQEAGVQPLSQEGPLQMETATHSSILASKVPWTEEPGGLQSLESEKSPPQLSD